AASFSTEAAARARAPRPFMVSASSCGVVARSAVMDGKIAHKRSKSTDGHELSTDGQAACVGPWSSVPLSVCGANLAPRGVGGARVAGAAQNLPRLLLDAGHGRLGIGGALLQIGRPRLDLIVVDAAHAVFLRP